MILSRGFCLDCLFFVNGSNRHNQGTCFHPLRTAIKANQGNKIGYYRVSKGRFACEGFIPMERLTHPLISSGNT